jgi:hypothetical protein
MLLNKKPAKRLKKSNHPKTKTQQPEKQIAALVVDLAGVEPASGQSVTTLSTCLVPD